MFEQVGGFLSSGYETRDVDEVIDRIVSTLRAHEEGRSEVDVTSAELDEVRFRMGRRGYDVAAVDQFIDEVTAQLRAYESRVTGG